MGRGACFTDERRGTLLNIRGRDSPLPWDKATEIFNRVFHKEPPRGSDALRQQMYHCKNDQKEVWERANANHADRDWWNQDVEDAIADQAANPNRPSLTKEPDPNSKWTHDMLQVCHLLMQDKSLNVSETVRIFNTLFEHLVNTRGRGRPISIKVLRRVYAQRGDNKQKNKKVDAEVEDEDDVEGPPTKKRKSSVKDESELTVSESWAIVSSKTKTEQEQEREKAWQEKIEEQMLVETDTEQTDSEESTEEQEQEPHHDLGEDVRQRRFIEDNEGDDDDEALVVKRTSQYAARHAGAAGHWRFITEEDERLAATHLGGRRGMPARPSAWDVRRYRLREVRAGRFPHYAINHTWIYNKHIGEPTEPMYETSREALLDYWHAVLKKICEAEELKK
jgi:hypothetical protein